MIEDLNYSKDDIEQMIIDSLNGELPASKASLLEQILARDAEAYQLWNDYNHIKRYTKGKRLERTVDVENEWVRFKSKINNPPRSRIWLRRYAAMFAAILLFTLGIGIWVYRLSDTEKEALEHVVKTEGQVSVQLGNEKAILLEGQTRLKLNHLVFEKGQFTSTAPDSTHITIQVPKGKIFQFSLDDGTKVALNSGSTFRFPVSFDSDERTVSLNGEAYFQVEKKDGIGFKVMASGMGIQVLGTRFNVRSYSNMPFITSLIEGKVQVNDYDQNSVYQLKPGYEVIKIGTDTHTQKIENSHVIKWIDGLTYFNNRPLSEIVDRIVLSTGYDIRVSDDRVGRLRFSGAFQRQDSLSTLLRLFSETSSVKYRVEDGHVILY